MKIHLKHFKALEKDIERRNAQFEKLTRGYSPHPHGMVTLNKRRQVHSKKGK